MNFFQTFIWPNMRKRIRSLGSDSVWYKFLSLMTAVMDRKDETALFVKKNIWLESAEDEGLNGWGKRHKVLRLEDESDEVYRARILFYRTISKSNLSRRQKSVIIENLLGLPAGSVHIDNGQDRVGFRIGDPIGTGIINRAYNIFSYTVFINTELSSEQRKILTDYIHLTNIGGNFPIFAEQRPTFDVFRMAGPIGSVIISKNEANTNVYDYY